MCEIHWPIYSHHLVHDTGDVDLTVVEVEGGHSVAKIFAYPIRSLNITGVSGRLLAIQTGVALQRCHIVNR